MLVLTHMPEVDITVTGDGGDRNRAEGPKQLEDTIDQKGSGLLARFAKIATTTRNRLSNLIPSIRPIRGRRAFIAGGAVSAGAMLLGDHLLGSRSEAEGPVSVSILRPEEIGIDSEAEPIDTYQNIRAIWRTQHDSESKAYAPSGPADFSTAELMHSSLGEVIVLKIDPFTILSNPDCSVNVKRADDFENLDNGFMLNPKQIAAMMNQENRGKATDDHWLTIIITSTPPEQQYDNVLVVPSLFGTSNAILDINFFSRTTGIGYHQGEYTVAKPRNWHGRDGMRFRKREPQQT